MRRITFLLIACAFDAGLASRAADLNEILQRSSAAFKSDWDTDPTYACLEKDEIEKNNKKTSKTFEVVMLDGSDYRMPVATNDQTFPPERRDLELTKLKNELKRRQAESPSARRSRIEAWKKRRNESGELLFAFPDVLTFALIGEDRKDGHPAYVLSATPKPGVMPANRAAKVLTGIEGKIWIEKETMHPIHIECTVVKAVPVYGMLASVLPGTDIEIRMTKVAESTWLIDVVSLKLNLAKLHFFKSAGTTRYTYTDYRPNTTELQNLLSEANTR